MAKRGYPFAPQIFLRPDGSLTDNPNEILSLLKDHAEKNYSHHRNTREDALFAQFVNLFQDEINNLKNSIKFTPFDVVNTWNFFQKKPANKATGLEEKA
jgi:L-rhamnose mutarotase